MESCSKFVKTWTSLMETILKAASHYHFDSYDTIWKRGYFFYKICINSLHYMLMFILILTEIKREDISTQMMINAFNLLFPVYALTNLYYFLRHGKEIQETMQKINIVWKTKGEEANAKTRQLIKCFFYTVICSDALHIFDEFFLWGFLPFFNGAYQKRILPFDTWYPFDWKASPYFEIIYTFQLLGVISLCTIVLAGDMCVVYLLTLTVYQFDVLYDQYKKCLNEIADESYIAPPFYNRRVTRTKYFCKMATRNVHRNTNAVKRFYLCIDEHKKLMEFCRLINKLLSPLINTNLSFIGVGFMMEFLVGNTLTGHQFLILFAGISFFQMYLYGSLGQLCACKSENIRNAVFHNRWYECNKRIKTCVLQIQTMCCKQVHISFLWMDLSLETVVLIAKAAYSASAVLRGTIQH